MALRLSDERPRPTVVGRGGLERTPRSPPPPPVSKLHGAPGHLPGTGTPLRAPSPSPTHRICRNRWPDSSTAGGPKGANIRGLVLEDRAVDTHHLLHNQAEQVALKMELESPRTCPRAHRRSHGAVTALCLIEMGSIKLLSASRDGGFTVTVAGSIQVDALCMSHPRCELEAWAVVTGRSRSLLVITRGLSLLA